VKKVQSTQHKEEPSKGQVSNIPHKYYWWRDFIEVEKG
jgi:hypothetical protein